MCVVIGRDGGEICLFLFNLEAVNFKAEISVFLIKTVAFEGFNVWLTISAPAPTILFIIPGFAAKFLTEFLIMLAGFKLS